MFRISSIRLSNFKNTNYGEIDFHTLPSGASITGIYGQNGSGKTSIVQAIECIDHIFSSGKLPEDSIDYIGIQAEFATIEVVFDYSGSSLGEGPDGAFIDSVRYLTRIGRKTDGSGAFVAEEKIWVGYAVGPWRRRLLVGQESVSPKGIDLPFDLSFDLAPARAPVVYSPVDRWKSIQAISADVKTGSRRLRILLIPQVALFCFRKVLLRP